MTCDMVKEPLYLDTTPHKYQRLKEEDLVFRWVPWGRHYGFGSHWATREEMMMMMIYLDKNYKGKDVFIKEEFTRKLTQQQRDGIRFLYRQFKKKKLGVILNDPYGKRVQTALFLNSIQIILESNFPCMVICYEDDMDKWRECFELWYPNSNTDVIYESDNPFVNKKIFVIPPADVAKYCRKRWSVVVVDNCFEDLKNLKKNKLLADFKIWISSKDIKKNFEFTPIHEWIYPNEKFNPEDFIPTSTSISHIVEKKLMLERFLEEFLLQSSDQELKFRRNVTEDANQELLNKTSKVSKKNKDPTGTKVKSSKKRKNIEEETNVTLDNNAQVSTDFDIGNAGLDKSKENYQESNPKIPQKNKDPTGTKVKSSKKIKVIEEKTNVTLDNTAQFCTDFNNFDVGNAVLNKSIENDQESNPEIPQKNKDPTGTKVKSSQKIEEETNVTLDNNAQVSTDIDNNVGNSGLDKSCENVQESNPETPPKDTNNAKGTTTNNGNSSSQSKDEIVDSKLTSSRNIGDGHNSDKKSMLERILSEYF